MIPMGLKTSALLRFQVCRTAYGVSIRGLTNVNLPEHPDQCPFVEAVSDSDPVSIPAKPDLHQFGRHDCHLFV